MRENRDAGVCLREVYAQRARVAARVDLSDQCLPQLQLRVFVQMQIAFVARLRLENRRAKRLEKYGIPLQRGVGAFFRHLSESRVHALLGKSGPKLAFAGEKAFEQPRGDAGFARGGKNQPVEAILPQDNFRIRGFDSARRSVTVFQQPIIGTGGGIYNASGNQRPRQIRVREGGFQIANAFCGSKPRRHAFCGRKRLPSLRAGSDRVAAPFVAQHIYNPVFLFIF